MPRQARKPYLVGPPSHLASPTRLRIRWLMNGPARPASIPHALGLDRPLTCGVGASVMSLSAGYRSHHTTAMLGSHSASEPRPLRLYWSYGIKPRSTSPNFHHTGASVTLQKTGSPYSSREIARSRVHRRRWPVHAPTPTVQQRVEELP